MTDGPALPPGCRLVELESTDSTNAYARKLALAGSPSGVAVWAHEQTAGRGRHGRDWISPRGNLYVSILFRPDCPPADTAQLGFVAGVALAQTVRAATGLAATLKWPNDMLINGRKASGISLESAFSGAAAPDWVVAGIGVNVAHAPPAVARATSLAAEGADSGVESLLEALLARLFTRFGEWQQAGFAPIRAAWLDLALPEGAEIQVRLPEGPVSGRFSGIDGQGSLLLETAAGTQRINVGDVFPLNPATQKAL